MTDVPSHSWIMPTLLRHAGVDLLHLGCNAACRSPQVPPLFWWEGPDGSRLLTMYTAEGYGTGLVPPPNWPHKTWLALIHTGDNHGPPTPAEVKKLFEEARARLPGVQVRIGRLSDFADGILAEKPDLAVIRGDMPDTWIHGPMCDPAGARIARNIRPAIAAAENLHTQLGAWGAVAPAADVAATIAAAYEQSLLYGEHTWGGALYWVTQYNADRKFNYGDTWKAERAQSRFQRLENSWKEHTSYIESARDLIQPLLDRDLHILAQAARAEGLRVVVYNPLPWKRDGWVSLPASPMAITAFRPVDGEGAVAAVEDDGALRFVARDVPALGYRTYVPVKAEAASTPLRVDESAATLENAVFKATLDPARGVVRSLIDKRSGRELVDAAAPHGFGQYLYERFDLRQTQSFVDAYLKLRVDWALNELGKPNLPPADQVPYRAASPQNYRVRFRQSPVSVTAVMEASATAEVPHGVTTTLTLPDQPYADLEIALRDKAADPWPEAGWLCLPLKVEQPQFRIGRLGSIIDPAKDIVPGTNHHLLALNSGLTVADPQGRGAGLCPLDNPLISLDAPGCWKYSPKFVPQRSYVYVNLFNNQWTTNFRLWNEGTWTARVRIWAVAGPDCEPGLVTPTQEARLPLLAAAATGAAGSLPAVQTGLELSRKGIAVTAFGPNPDGRGLLLRLWEQAGRAGTCVVSLPAKLAIRTVQPVDLRGRPKGPPLPVRDSRFEVPVGAFAPASFELREAEGTKETREN
jgi:hypothetical protein